MHTCFMKSSLIFAWHVFLMTLWIHCTKAYKAELCVSALILKVMTFNITFLYLIFHIKIQTLPLFRFYLSNQCLCLNFSVLCLFILFLSLSITSLTQTCEEWNTMEKCCLSSCPGFMSMKKIVCDDLARYRWHHMKAEGQYIYRNSNWAWSRQL